MSISFYDPDALKVTIDGTTFRNAHHARASVPLGMLRPRFSARVRNRRLHRTLRNYRAGLRLVAKLNRENPARAAELDFWDHRGFVYSLDMPF